MLHSYPRSEEDESKSKNVWLKGHTGRVYVQYIHIDILITNPQDFGTLTILYSQPVAALQILTPAGTWKWVRHIDNALVCIMMLYSLD